jgi:hypothetical protein
MPSFSLEKLISRRTIIKEVLTVFNRKQFVRVSSAKQMSLWRQTTIVKRKPICYLGKVGQHSDQANKMESIRLMANVWEKTTTATR